MKEWNMHEALACDLVPLWRWNFCWKKKIKYLLRSGKNSFVSSYFDYKRGSYKVSLKDAGPWWKLMDSFFQRLYGPQSCVHFVGAETVLAAWAVVVDGLFAVPSLACVAGMDSRPCSLQWFLQIVPSLRSGRGGGAEIY